MNRPIGGAPGRTPTFNTITGDDWKKSIRGARQIENSVSKQIKERAPRRFSTVVELLEDPRRWTQNAYARDREGRNLSRGMHDEDGACAWCLMGALLTVYKDKSWEDFQAIRRRVLDVVGDIFHFNDTHTHAEVVAAARRAGV